MARSIIRLKTKVELAGKATDNIGRWTISCTAPSIFQTSYREAAMNMFITIVAREAVPMAVDAVFPILLS